ncbi:type II secretion system F family protein [uncultured Methanobrevibacter sp.]|uniref:type II secretion system F family protein n=1 Tax=uncultured Methanobrevibacter sp. TaxID=253161 RepID=UPI0025E0EA7C|nr:type II secretion system F family protein [uncultured Methanobrevibacter sp.]
MSILEKFFIAIGEVVLSIIDHLKNLSLKNIEIKRNERNTEMDSAIFERLNIDIDVKMPSQEDRFDDLRNALLPYLLTKTSIGIVLLMLILSLLFSSLEITSMILVVVVMIYIFILYYPKIKEQKSYSDINQELPYALRHMGIELKSGKGLHDSMVTIKNANYGSLSLEFNRVLEEVKFGKSTEDSLLEMSHRVKSEGLTRAIHQIISTLRVGGNLSGSLDVIAQDISFDMQIKLKEYSQKLNSFILIYTFIAILTPTISLIMLMAGSTVMGDVISSELLLIIYTLFFPMIVMFMGVFIKKLEPKI